MAGKRPINEVIAENLAECMAQHKTLKTQAALAKASGVGQTTISLYLNPHKRKASATGKEPSAKVAEIALLADALGVGAWVLLREMTPSQRAYYKRMEDAYAELVASDPHGIDGNTGPGTLP